MLKLERVEIHYLVYTWVFDGSFEHKTRGRLLHLAKRFGGVQKGGIKHIMICFVPHFATEECSFGAETFC